MSNNLVACINGNMARSEDCLFVSHMFSGGIVSVTSFEGRQQIRNAMSGVPRLTLLRHEKCGGVRSIYDVTFHSWTFFHLNDRHIYSFISGENRPWPPSKRDYLPACDKVLHLLHPPIIPLVPHPLLPLGLLLLCP